MIVRRLGTVTRVALACIALILTGCAATTLKSSWTDSDYKGPPLETAVYGVNASVLLWSRNTETFEPTSVQKDAPGFAKVIINSLKQQKLI